MTTDVVPIQSKAAQGDVFIRKIAKLPDGVVRVDPVPGIGLILAHSETGHHHVVEDLSCFQFKDPKDPLIGYLQLGDGCQELGGADLIHKREWDTHKTRRMLGAPGDVFQVIRQREKTPSGWARVKD